MKKYVVRVSAITILFIVILFGIREYYVQRQWDRDGYTHIYRASEPEEYDFMVQVPTGGFWKTRVRPVLIYLHGVGEVNADFSTLASCNSYFYAKMGRVEKFPFIVVTPVCDKKEWEPYRIIAVLDRLSKDHSWRYRIDSKHVYLTGYSMGGFGTFATAIEYPDRFAAIVPVAGGGEPLRAAKLKSTPIWSFHGEKDKTVPVASSSDLIRAVKDVGNPNVMETIIPNAEHGIQEKVYTMPEVYRWMNSF